MKPLLLCLLGWALIVAVDGQYGHGETNVTADRFRYESECQDMLNSPQVRLMLDSQLQPYIIAGDHVRYYCKNMDNG